MKRLRYRCIDWWDENKDTIFTITLFVAVIGVVSTLQAYEMAHHKKQVSEFFGPVDAHTDAPMAGCLFRNDTLPDGHYTVAVALPHGEAIVLQHHPGPHGSFAYYLADTVRGTPNNRRPGDRFTVFNGKAV